MSGQCSSREERARSEDGRMRLPMAAISAFCGFAAGFVSPGARGVRVAILAPPPRQSGADGQCGCTTHAEITRSDEPASSSCPQRHHRSQRSDDPGCDSAGRKRPTQVGGVAGWPREGQRRNHSEILGGGLPAGTPFYFASKLGGVAFPPEVDRRV